MGSSVVEHILVGGVVQAEVVLAGVVVLNDVDAIDGVREQLGVVVVLVVAAVVGSLDASCHSGLQCVVAAEEENHCG